MKVMMNIRRYKKRTFVVLLFFLGAFLMLNHVFFAKEESCIASADIIKKIDELAFLIDEPLTALNLTFFLCYNSLWGALKLKGPLPWQKSLDLCVLNQEISAIDEGYLARSFKRNGLYITYNSAVGVYTVTKFGQTVPFVSLTVFEKDPVTHQMRRVGWMHRMLPPNSCEELQCFPPELISQPLPLSTFGKQLIPVPRDEIEIQKYLFPYSWWKEIEAPDCKNII